MPCLLSRFHGRRLWARFAPGASGWARPAASPPACSPATKRTKLLAVTGEELSARSLTRRMAEQELQCGGRGTGFNGLALRSR
mmetsp:Transcript_42043/g.125888  ORF Transcript_42043/g.125888 Transcript_42043/m.125888 type:complete len:83 (+) Transcript_42043:901-1149(+)|eukprot:364669-Chlamydomonas_euryale.AAC.6